MKKIFCISCSLLVILLNIFDLLFNIPYVNANSLSLALALFTLIFSIIGSEY